MKKRSIYVVLALICSVALFTSCESPIEAKALVVKNTGSHAIYFVKISQIVSGAKNLAYPENALDVDETIAPGESKTFYLAPYGKNDVYIQIEDESIGEAETRFTYDYLKDGKNETITATFDGTDISLSGSNVEEVLLS